MSTAKDDSDKKYCYPGSTVLKNKANITDRDKFAAFERDATHTRILEIRSKPVTGNFDYQHLKDIHKAVFQDVYAWAGQPRTVDIAKTNLFCRVMFLTDNANIIFGNIKKDGYLISADKDKTLQKLAEYMGDINALHAFREGNGRTLREFIYCVAKAAGIELSFRQANADEMMQASIQSFKCDYSKFKEIFARIASPLSLEEQRDFISQISKDILSRFNELARTGNIKNRVDEFAVTVAAENNTLSMDGWKNEINNARNAAREANNANRELESNIPQNRDNRGDT